MNSGIMEEGEFMAKEEFSVEEELMEAYGI